MYESSSMDLSGLLSEKAALYPDFPIYNYLADGESDLKVLTYSDFEAKSKAVAASLQALGLEGQRVLLLFPQGLDYLIALFGCLYARVIAVPAYPPRNNRNLQRLEAIISDCNAKAIIADVKGVEHLIKMKRDFSSFKIYAIESLLAQQEDYQIQTIASDQIAYLQYTSGSTGNPKGVVIRHENMLHNIKCQVEIFGDEKIHGRTFCTWAPMYHDMGLMSMMTALKTEGVCYFMSPVHFIQKPARWLQAISKYGAEYSLGPNFAFDYCTDKILDEEMEGVDLSNWWIVTNGSEQVRLDTLMRFADRFKNWGFNIEAFCPAYGMAETTLIVSTIKGTQAVRAINKNTEAVTDFSSASDITIDDPHAYLISTGEVVTDAKVVIVEPNRLEVLAEGKEGEIWVDNPGSIASGYWQNEDATKASFNQILDSVPGHAFLRTGDLGFIKEGHLYITGRIKDMVIIRGRNYYPQDIELIVQESHEALETHSGAAFAIDDGQEEKLVLVQEINRNYLRSVDTKELINLIRKTVAQEFDVVPSRIVLIKPLSLPKTSSGKIQRYLTKEQMLEGKLRIIDEWHSADTSTTSIEPSSPDIEGPVNKEVITAWLVKMLSEKAKLPIEEIDVHAQVRDYPLESIDAIFVADELSKWLEINVSPDSFWALPSIDALAGFLEKKYKERND